MSKYLKSDTDLEVTCNGNSQSCFFFFLMKEKSQIFEILMQIFTVIQHIWILKNVQAEIKLSAKY